MRSMQKERAERRRSDSPIRGKWSNSSALKIRGKYI
jgi:hypothetical protein